MPLLPDYPENSAEERAFNEGYAFGLRRRTFTTDKEVEARIQAMRNEIEDAYAQGYADGRFDREHKDELLREAVA